MARISLSSRCGLFCGACPTNDKKCQGCKVDNEHAHNPECVIKACVVGKKIDNCSECEDFPCEQVNTMKNSEHAHYRTAYQNLLRIKEVGLNKWIREQKIRWTCPDCGTGFSWHDTACGYCKKTVASVNAV